MINVTTKLQRKGDLKRHNMSVHKAIKYQCKECDYKATLKENLKKHKMSVHIGFKYARDQCDSTTKLHKKGTSRNIDCQFI